MSELVASEMQVVVSGEEIPLKVKGLHCYRCGKRIPEKHHMIQNIVYLGDPGPRHDICEDCYVSFLNWLCNRNMYEGATCYAGPGTT